MGSAFQGPLEPRQPLIVGSGPGGQLRLDGGLRDAEAAADDLAARGHAGRCRGPGAQQPGTQAEVPGLPSEIDIETTAGYTRRVLAGELPVPHAIAQQVAQILQLAQLAQETETAETP